MNTTHSNFRADTLANSLDNIAESFLRDAKALKDFADQLRNDDADYTGTALHSNVVILIGRVMNSSSWVGSAESALHAASELVRGDK